MYILKIVILFKNGNFTPKSNLPKLELLSKVEFLVRERNFIKK